MIWHGNKDAQSTLPQELPIFDAYGLPLKVEGFVLKHMDNLWHGQLSIIGQDDNCIFSWNSDDEPGFSSVEEAKDYVREQAEKTITALQAFLDRKEVNTEGNAV